MLAGPGRRSLAGAAGAATHTAAALEQAAVEDHLVDNADRPVAEVAAEALRLAGWLPSSP